MSTPMGSPTGTNVVWKWDGERWISSTVGGSTSDWTITKETRHIAYAYGFYQWYSSAIPVPPTPGMYWYECRFVLFQRMAVYQNFIYNAYAKGFMGIVRLNDGTVRSWDGNGNTETFIDEAKGSNNMAALTWAYDNNSEVPRIYAGAWLDSGLDVNIDTEFRFHLIGSTVQ